MNGYELVGDDSFGSIGADILFGDDDDESLLDALAVSGLGNSELIGAANPALLQKVKARAAAAVVSRGLDRKRRYPLGFVPTSIASAASSSIPAAPQNLFRPERLIIPSDIAFDFGVRDVKVGNQSQLAQSVEVPGAIFSEVAINTGVTFDTAEVGNQVSVDARNKSAGTLEFSAALVGSIAK